MRTIRLHMTPLRQRMLEDMQLRNYSPLTIDCYLRCVADFARHCGASPSTWARSRSAPISSFSSRTSRWPGPPWVQTVCALRFFYRITLGRPGDAGVYRLSPTAFHPPDDSESGEVAALLTASHSLKHRHPHHSMPRGCGCPNCASCRSPISTAHAWSSGYNQGKGQHDRYVMLSPKLLPLLRQYWQQSKPRPWLFPGHPRTRPMTTRAVYNICRDAGQAAHLPKAIHPICFATPLRLISLQAGWICGGSNSCWAIGACAVPAATSMSPHALRAPEPPRCVTAGEAVMNRPSLEVADVVRQYGAASLSRYGSTLSGAAPPSGRLLSAGPLPWEGTRRSVTNVVTWRLLILLLWQSTLPEVSREGTSRLARGPRSGAARRALPCGVYAPIPSTLALQNPRVIYNLLFQAVAETLLTVARDPHYLGADIGILAVPAYLGAEHLPPSTSTAGVFRRWALTRWTVGSLSASILPPGPCPESGVPSSVPHLAPSGLHGRCLTLEGAVPHPHASRWQQFLASLRATEWGGVCKPPGWSWTGAEVSGALYASRGDRESAPAGLEEGR